MEFRTLKEVPICSTGTYKLASGDTTFTADDLAAAVLAAKDETVSAPRIKLGHIDKRFESDPSLDGEPAMGIVENMALTDDGQTIVGDLTKVPAWLADSMESAYPGRSVEGGFGLEAPSGHKYGFAISNLALLGTEWPGVSSLPDLQATLEKNGKPNEGIEAKAERVVMAKMAERVNPEPVKAGLDFGSIPRTFAADLRAGRVPKSGDLDQAKWWPRSVEAGDDGALSILVDTAADKLLRLPIIVADKALNYGEPTPVTASTGAITADNTKGQRVLASYPSHTPEKETTITMKINGKEIAQAVVAKSLGLADDADEQTILAKLGVKADEKPEPAKPAPTNVPPGMVLVDSTILSEVQAGAAAGKTAAQTLDQQERDAVITAAIEGKVPGDKGNARIVASQRGAWEQRWAADRDGTKTFLTAAADKGGIAALIPASNVEAGRSGDGDGDATVDQAVEAAFDARFFPELVPTPSQEAA